jgi:protein SCO1/2
MTQPTTDPAAPKGTTTRYILLGVIAVALVGIGAALGMNVANEILGRNGIDITAYSGTVYDPPQPLPDFTLAATDESDFTRADLQGKWSLIFFGYTNCPDFCPLTLAEFKNVKSQLTVEAAEAVQFVFISVDAMRDTPAVLDVYLERFDPAFVGATGDDAALAALQPAFGFYYERRTDTGSAASYLVDHTTRSYLVDARGQLCMTYAYGTEPEIIAESLMQQTARGDVCSS